MFSHLQSLFLHNYQHGHSQPWSLVSLWDKHVFQCQFSVHSLYMFLNLCTCAGHLEVFPKFTLPAWVGKCNHDHLPLLKWLAFVQAEIFALICLIAQRDHCNTRLYLNPPHVLSGQTGTSRFESSVSVKYFPYHLYKSWLYMSLAV